MSCSTCGEPGHNARGCNKLSNNVEYGQSSMGEHHKKKKQSNKGRKPMKRQRTLLDEDEGDEVPRSPTAATIEELPLSAPQSRQISQASEARQFIFMPTPKVHMQQ